MAKVLNNTENSRECRCPSCPTYTSYPCSAAKGEKLFCARGKSECELVQNGCICNSCPVWEKYGLESGYFCFNGEAE